MPALVLNNSNETFNSGSIQFQGDLALARNKNYKQKHITFAATALRYLKGHGHARKLCIPPLGGTFAQTIRAPRHIDRIKIPIHPRQRVDAGTKMRPHPLTEKYIEIGINRHYNWSYGENVLDDVGKAGKDNTVAMNTFAAMQNMAAVIDKEILLQVHFAAARCYGFRNSDLRDAPSITDSNAGIVVHLDDLARQMKENLLDFGSRRMICTPRFIQAVRNDYRRVINPELVKSSINTSPESTAMTMISGFELLESNILSPFHVAKTQMVTTNIVVGGAVGDANQRIGNKIMLKTVAGTETIKAGTSFVIQGVYDLNEQTYESTTELKQFKVLPPDNATLEDEDSQHYTLNTTGVEVKINPDLNPGSTEDDFRQRIKVDGFHRTYGPLDENFVGGDAANAYLATADIDGQNDGVSTTFTVYFDEYQNCVGTPGADAPIRFVDYLYPGMIDENLFENVFATNIADANNILGEVLDDEDVEFQRGCAALPGGLYFMFADVPIVKEMSYGMRMSMDGMSIAVHGNGDITNLSSQKRLDIRFLAAVADQRSLYTVNYGATTKRS